MNRTFIFSLFFLATLSINAQEKGINPNDPSFIKKYENFDFKGQFASLIDKEGQNNFFLVDFTKLPTWFERVYFMNQSFSYHKIVNIDPGITKNRICFISNKMNDEADVLKIFDELKKTTESAAKTWSEGEKSLWLKENDKYK